MLAGHSLSLGSGRIPCVRHRRDVARGDHCLGRRSPRAATRKEGVQRRRHVELPHQLAEARAAVLDQGLLRPPAASSKATSSPHRGEPQGYRVLRLLKQGVFDFAAALPIYVEDGGAVIEASTSLASPELQDGHDIRRLDARDAEGHEGEARREILAPSPGRSRTSTAAAT